MMLHEFIWSYFSQQRLNLFLMFFFFLSRFTTSLILLLGFRSADGDDTVVVFHSIVFLFL